MKMIKQLTTKEERKSLRLKVEYDIKDLKRQIANKRAILRELGCET